MFYDNIPPSQIGLAWIESFQIGFLLKFLKHLKHWSGHVMIVFVLKASCILHKKLCKNLTFQKHLKSLLVSDVVAPNTIKTFAFSFIKSEPDTKVSCIFCTVHSLLSRTADLLTICNVIPLIPSYVTVLDDIFHRKVLSYSLQCQFIDKRSSSWSWRRSWFVEIRLGCHMHSCLGIMIVWNREVMAETHLNEFITQFMLGQKEKNLNFLSCRIYPQLWEFSPAHHFLEAMKN